MASRKRWFRLNTTWAESEWLECLDWATRAVWVELLAYVKQNGTKGRCTSISATRFAGFRMIPVENVQALLDAAIKADALQVSDGCWVITKWNEYQEVDDSSERVAALRAREREQKEAETVTVGNGSVTADFENVTVCNGVTGAKTGGVTVENDENGTCNGVTPMSRATDRHIDIKDNIDIRDNKTERHLDISRGEEKKSNQPKGKFVPPTVEELSGYMASRRWLNSQRKAEQFIAYYTNTDWKVGKAKTPMKDWKSAVITWEGKMKPDEFTAEPIQEKKEEPERIDGYLPSEFPVFDDVLGYWVSPVTWTKVECPPSKRGLKP